MYTDQLREIELEFNQIYLDPNNPRFWTQKTRQDHPDSKIPDEKVQDRAFDDINEHGIRELRDSILRNGFLPLDRIVVRRIASHDNKYVIVEGNRRFAALKSIRDEIDEGTVNEDGITEDYLDKILADTNSLKVLLYQGTETHDISWLLQGIRHISGIRPWSPAQRARLVAEQIEEKQLGFRAAGQTFGLSAQAVGRLYRAYKALEQMRNHEEFSVRAKNDYFTLFEETIRNRDVREWLGWNNQALKFENENRLVQFYGWISPDEEHDNERRIHDPRQIKDLGFLISGGHHTLITKIDSYEITIEKARGQIEGMQSVSDWKSKIEEARRLIAELPQEAMFEDPGGFRDALVTIERQIKNRKEVVMMAINSGIGAGAT